MKNIQYSKDLVLSKELVPSSNKPKNSKWKHVNQLNKSSKKSQQRSLNQSSNQKDILLNKRIVSPQKLKILVLSGNQLLNDQLQFLSKCINLIKLDLSHNHITKLHERFGIQKIKNLRVLSLEANKLYAPDSIQVLFGMKHLWIFNYRDNPLQQNAKSEHLIVNSFPDLKIINGRIVFVQQRDPSLTIDRKNQWIANDFEQWQPAEHSQKYYLKVLKLQLQYVDNIWMFHNPIVYIQRIWKGIIEQGQIAIKQSPNASTQRYRKTKTPNNYNINESESENDEFSSMRKAFKQWKQFSSNIRSVKNQMSQTKFLQEQGDQYKIIELQNKAHLTYQITDYYLAKRNLRIKTDLGRFVKRIRSKLYIRKMAWIFRRNILIKKLNFSNPFTSYYNLSGMQQSKRVYFNRVQQHLIQNFLAHIAKNFGKHKQIYQQSSYGIANQYVSIRLTDPDTYSSKTNYNTFTYLLWPSSRAVILKKKRFPYKLKSSIIKIKALSYIKNRDKKLTAQQIKKSVKTYQRVDRFFQHEYNQSMGFFECKDQFVLQHLIRIIYYHNTKALSFQKIIQRSEMMSLLQNYQENVAIYTEKLLERTTSAVKIQQQWRRYINNKKQTESIYDKLKKNRASRLIQRFLRDRVFYHRLSFQRNLSLDLSSFAQQDLLIHENLYFQLSQIIAASEQHVQLYKNLQISFNNDKIQLYHDQFNKKEVFFPNLRKLHFGRQNFELKDNRSLEKVDIYKFFHQNSNVKIIQCKGEKFYQFTYSTAEEAKLRAACFALLTYRLYGSTYLLPLSKSTLYMYNERVEIYKKYGVNCKKFQISVEQQNLGKLKVNLVTDISMQSKRNFLFIDLNYESLFTKTNLYSMKKLPLQFYQKRFQDYPEKYENVMTIVSHCQDQSKQFSIKATQKLLTMKKLLISESDIKNQNLRNNQFKSTGFKKDDSWKQASNKLNTTKINIVSPSAGVVQQIFGLNENQSLEQQKLMIKYSNLPQIGMKEQNNKFDLSIRKTYEKHLSLYELDVPPSLPSNFNPQSKAKTQILLPKNSIQQTEIKKQNVIKYLQSQRQKRQYIKQKKQVDLSLVRQKRRQQKMMNMTLRSFNQSQRTQLLRKKVQKVKQYKRRSISSSLNNKSNESDFIQQGNFIMEQQLKMNLMRNRIKQVQKLKDKRKSLSQTKNLMDTTSENKKSQDSKSVRSNQSIKKKKMFFEGKDIQILGLDNKITPSATLEKHSNQLYGGQNQIVNKKSFVKKRSSKGGAYLRDPSFVHGVFPEEYYPIQTGKGGIVFPKVI